MSVAAGKAVAGKQRSQRRRQVGIFASAARVPIKRSCCFCVPQKGLTFFRSGRKRARIGQSAGSSPAILVPAVRYREHAWRSPPEGARQGCRSWRRGGRGGSALGQRCATHSACSAATQPHQGQGQQDGCIHRGRCRCGRARQAAARGPCGSAAANSRGEGRGCKRQLDAEGHAHAA